MPKVVDNYVFERKIGSGQYGDVFKGYNKVDNSDIAIKAIKRENIKGSWLATQGSSWSCSRTRSRC
jgi:serine/threonine-protein kinase ULK/ATG1